MILALLPGLLQLVPSVISGIEHLFGKGKGSTKKTAAMNILTEVATAFATLTKPGSSLDTPTVNLISTIVDEFVTYFNATGQFQHGATQ